jgi:hypothetical protein
MDAEGYNHKGYEVFPAAIQLRNDDGTGGDYYPTATVARWLAAERVSVPYSWHDHRFKSADEARAFAAHAAHDLIERGELPF